MQETMFHNHTAQLAILLFYIHYIMLYDILLYYIIICYMFNNLQRCFVQETRGECVRTAQAQSVAALKSISAPVLTSASTDHTELTWIRQHVPDTL